jgi:hypothetical protein
MFTYLKETILESNKRYMDEEELVRELSTNDYVACIMKRVPAYLESPLKDLLTDKACLVTVVDKTFYIENGECVPLDTLRT